MQAESTALNFPFEKAEQQRESALFGMWIFLSTEVLFFGGLFVAYLVYRFTHHEAFAEAGRHQEWYLGLANTVVLILSGFTMAVAVDFARLGRRTGLLWLYSITWLLGAVFLAIEGFEYRTKFAEHLVPGTGFHFAGHDPAGSELFFDLYFTMTGLHMLHMVIGLLFVGGFGAWAALTRGSPLQPNKFEVLGLYWGFVDIVWLFLYPLFYLVNPV